MRLAVLFTALALSGSAALAQAPHLSGALALDPARGTVRGDLCLSNLPAQDTLRFLLHKGLNVRHVRTPAGGPLASSGHIGLQPVGVALQYTVAAPETDALCVAYTGAYPVYTDQSAPLDASEFIAFNGRTVRAPSGTAWYPTLYDPASDRQFGEVTYDLDVQCDGCAGVYMNGAPPQPGPVARLVSDQPRDLLLYAGEVEAREVAGTLFLNSDITEGDARTLGRKVDEVKRYYEDALGLPYGDTVVFMEFEPVEYFPPERNWAFVVWPTLAWANVDLGAFARALDDDQPAPWIWATLGHEMAHYYFGTLVSPVGPYAQFFKESIPEYLAYGMIRRAVGEEALRNRVRAHFQEVLNGPDLTPLDQITPEKPVGGNRYRYRYGPLLLLALEREVGEDRMHRLITALLTSPDGARLDYGSLRAAARAAGVPDDTWRRYEEACVRPSARESCLADLAP